MQVHDAGLAQAKLEREIKKGTDLKHTETTVHDAGLQQAKLEREIKGKHELHHVDAPKVRALFVSLCLCVILCPSVSFFVFSFSVVCCVSLFAALD